MKNLALFLFSLGLVFLVADLAEAGQRRKLFRGKGRQAVKAGLNAARFVLPPYCNGKCHKP